MTPSIFPLSTNTPSTDSGTAGSVVLGLELWEVGLIAANAVVILALLLCMCTLCLSRRRRANSHHHHHRRDPEHFPLKEIEGYDNKDSVDCSSMSTISLLYCEINYLFISSWSRVTSECHHLPRVIT